MLKVYIFQKSVIHDWLTYTNISIYSSSTIYLFFLALPLSTFPSNDKISLKNILSINWMLFTKSKKFCLTLDNLSNLCLSHMFLQMKFHQLILKISLKMFFPLWHNLQFLTIRCSLLRSLVLQLQQYSKFYKSLFLFIFHFLTSCFFSLTLLILKILFL